MPAWLTPNRADLNRVADLTRTSPQAEPFTIIFIISSLERKALSWLARHQPALLGFGVRLLEAGEVHVSPCQGDACGFLVLFQSGRVDSGNLVEVVVETPRVAGRPNGI
jgi:hypothetical protein